MDLEGHLDCAFCPAKFELKDWAYFNDHQKQHQEAVARQLSSTVNLAKAVFGAGTPPPTQISQSSGSELQPAPSRAIRVKTESQPESIATPGTPPATFKEEPEGSSLLNRAEVMPAAETPPHSQETSADPKGKMPASADGFESADDDFDDALLNVDLDAPVSNETVSPVCRMYACSQRHAR
jgi:hypothetical protein